MRRRFTIAIIGTVLATLSWPASAPSRSPGSARASRPRTGCAIRPRRRPASSTSAPPGAGEANTQASRRERFTPRPQRTRRSRISAWSHCVPTTRSGSRRAIRFPTGSRLNGCSPTGCATARPRAVRSATRCGPRPRSSDSQGALGVVVLTRPVDRALGPAVGWFLLASLVAILIAAFVASRLAKQLTKPLRSATEATARIAAGDLSVRLPADERRHDEITESVDGDQPDGGNARTVTGPRAAVPAVGVARPAHPAHLDPRLRRGHRRRHRARQSGRGRRSSWPRRDGSSGWSRTCSTWPSSRRGSSRWTSSPVDVAELARRGVGRVRA